MILISQAKFGVQLVQRERAVAGSSVGDQRLFGCIAAFQIIQMPFDGFPNVECGRASRSLRKELETGTGLIGKAH